MGCSWPGVFLLGASGRTGRFFTQLLFHDPISISLWSSSLELYVTWIVYYVSIWHVAFSLFVNKPSAWFEASRTQGLWVFLLWQTEIERRVVLVFMIIDAAVVNIPIPNSVLHRRVLSNAKKGTAKTLASTLAWRRLRSRIKMSVKSPTQLVAA